MTDHRNWGGKRSGAGRPPGSKNRRTEAAQELLERLECDPIEGMALIANNDRNALGIAEDVPIALRAKMYVELAPYVAPKLRATEITHYGGEHPRLVVQLPSELREALEERANGPLGDYEED